MLTVDHFAMWRSNLSLSLAIISSRRSVLFNKVLKASIDSGDPLHLPIKIYFLADKRSWFFSLQFSLSSSKMPKSLSLELKFGKITFQNNLKFSQNIFTSSHSINKWFKVSTSVPHLSQFGLLIFWILWSHCFVGRMKWFILYWNHLT